MVIPWVGDTEVYPNCLIAAFYNLTRDEYKIFGFWEHIDDRKALVAFLTDPDNIFIDYNGIMFDGVIWQAIIDDPDVTHEELLELRDKCIESRSPLIPEWKRDFIEYDLLRIWHYNNRARMTSLKHLEFVYRLKSIKDLPYHYNSKIKTQTAYDNVSKYCCYDLKPTALHFHNTKERIRARHQVMQRFGINCRNMPDSSMGLEIIMYNISAATGISMRDLKRKWTDHEKIVVKDLVLPQWRSRGGITEKICRDHFDPIVLYGEKDEDSGRMVFNFKGNLYPFDWQDMEVVIGFGGIHGCVKPGVYESTSSECIKSSDVTSQYPNAVFNFNIFPAHLGPVFTTVFKEKVYKERANYPKKTHFAMNMTYKLACNAAVGKFKDKWSPLYDPPCNLKVTVNCQMAILALAEDLMNAIPDAQLLMLNTDGLEIKIPREYESTWQSICDQWEADTKFALEHMDYEKMVINNVNNYIAVDTSGGVKRKGRFCTYEDYIKREDFHRDPSATIIPHALSEYFVRGIPIEDTVNGCDNIHEFVYGVKKTRSFRYAVIIPNPDRTITIKKFDERVFRYYISNSPKSGNLVKMWHDGRMNAVNKGDLIMPCLSLRTEKAHKFTDLDRQYYIDKAHEIRSEIEFS